MSIAFVDLKAQFRRLESDIRARMDQVLEHGQFIMGPEIEELETALAKFAGVDHVVTVGSGTDALLMTLLAYGVKAGDAVFVPTFTFIATAEVVSLLGATPVFVDVDPRTFNIDPEALARAIARTRETGVLEPRVVIPVDLFGAPADYDRITPIADDEQLTVVCDAAQSFGATLKNRRVGGLGDTTAVSFFPAKPLGCYGDGGAILTDDEAMADRLRSLRVHGKGDHKYDNVRIGLNGRLDTLQAAILLPKLAVLADEIESRNRVAAEYTKRLSALVTTPHVRGDCLSAWAQYAILSPVRDQFAACLKAASIPTAIYYPKPLHLQTAFTYLGGRVDDCPVAEQISSQILSLPMHPYLENAQINEICNELEQSMSTTGET